MFVSVVIPTYNRVQLLVHAIDSVLAQSYQDHEVIIVDDGSTDNTFEVLRSYGDRIKVIRQSNRGEGAARNAGIEVAQGEYIAFLDSDDIWMPDKLISQAALLNREPDLVWAYCDAYVFYDDLNQPIYCIGETMRQPVGDISRALIMGNFIPSPTPIVKADIFPRLGYFSNLKVGADWEMWLRIASKYPVGYVDKVLAGYRVHRNAIMQQEDIASILDKRCKVVEIASKSAPDAYLNLEGRAMAMQYILAGREMMKKNDRAGARRYFQDAITYAPTRLLAYLSFLSTFLPFRVYHAGRSLRSDVKKEKSL